MTALAGIYLHVPFCRKACSYCDFHFSTNLVRLEEMAAALVQEAGLRKDFFPTRPLIDTIYYGGGTPSLLPTKLLGRTLDALMSHWEVAGDAELTLEANPDDMDAASLKGWRDMGINRLSIGIQSFADADLTLLNRNHDAQQADRAVKMAQDMGFENITIDLIYGIPGSGKAVWEANVEKAVTLGVPHVSAYALTVEEKTLLHRQVSSGKVRLEPDAAHELQYFHLIDRLGEAGILQYELSNFAREGFRSRHNSAYWRGRHYLGLGPSAHGYDGRVRSHNIANNAAYLRSISLGQPAIAHEEELTARDRFNEFVMTQLRTVEGLDLDAVMAEWGKDLRVAHEEDIHDWQRQGWVLPLGQRLQLTRNGFMVSDAIIRELFWVDDEE